MTADEPSEAWPDLTLVIADYLHLALINAEIAEMQRIALGES